LFPSARYRLEHAEKELSEEEELIASPQQHYEKKKRNFLYTYFVNSNGTGENEGPQRR
jgi:hypothetical protein